MYPSINGGSPVLHKWDENNTDLCPLSHETEDIQHLWVCPNTLQNFENLLDKTKTLIIDRYKDIATTSVNKVINLIQMNNSRFLQTLLSKGIVTNAIYLHLLTDFSRNALSDSVKLSKLLVPILDCWLSAFHELVWCPNPNSKP